MQRKTIIELQREIDKKEQALVTCGKESGTTIVHMMRSMPCLRFYSSFLLLQRLLKQYECDILHKHMNKLRQLYAGSVVLPESKNNIINLSSYQLTQQEENLLNHGLNFSIKSKINPITAKIEMEKLFFDVKCNESQRKIEIHDEADLKVKLQNFAIKNTTDHSKDSITKEERAALKNLRNNKEIVIQRPDKGGGVVVMDSEYYNSKLGEIVSDVTKFETCPQNQTKITKKAINRAIADIKVSQPDVHKQLKITGDFSMVFQRSTRMPQPLPLDLS